MEFFAFPVALFLLAVWVAITRMIVKVAVAMVAGAPGRPIPQLLAAVGAVALAWLIPNAPGLLERHSMRNVITDCGWTINKKAPPVDGIFADQTERAHMAGYTDTYLMYYPKVQASARIGEIQELSRTAAPRVIPQRTMRYGIRLDREELPHHIDRFTQLVMDYDKNEVLGKYVIYDFTRRSNGKGVLALAFDVLTIGPKQCETRADEFQEKLRTVLPAAGQK